MTSSGIVLAQVLQELGIMYSHTDADEVVFSFTDVHGKPHFIINNILGLNSEVDVKLCADKAYTYDVLHTVVAFPNTLQFLDPKGVYGEYAQQTSQEEIVHCILEAFSPPVVVKKNSGSLGSHVFLCKSKSQVEQAVAQIFNTQSRGYDHVLLAQEAINSAEEWRVIMLHGQIQFFYKKDISEAHFTGNLSPLHWEKSVATLESDSRLQAEIQAFLDPIFKVWQLPYGGFDVMRDLTGKLWLIEINSHPAFSIFLRDNDSKPLKNVFRKIVQELRYGTTNT